MDSKTCFKCGETKSLDEFYPHPKMKDGTVNKCKPCTRRDVRQNRALKVEYYRQYDRDRGKVPGRYAGKKKRASQQIAAHNAVKRAIERGDLIRPEVCSRCPSTENIQAHHDDHTRLLDVMWLCPVCHAARHKELGLLSTMDD